jgi:hypothetical protein
LLAHVYHRRRFVVRWRDQAFQILALEEQSPGT